MNTTPETVIRFAGHDLTLTGDQSNIDVIIRAIKAIEKQPKYMTDIFNLSSESNEFYKFEADGISIQGERHFLLAISDQLFSNPTTVVHLAKGIHDIVCQISRAFKSNIASYDPDFAAQYRVFTKKTAQCKIYRFSERSLVTQGEEHQLIYLAKTLRSVESNGGELSGILSDLIYQIEYAFDIDGVRSEDSEVPFDPDFADQYLVQI